MAGQLSRATANRSGEVGGIPKAGIRPAHDASLAFFSKRSGQILEDAQQLVPEVKSLLKIAESDGVYLTVSLNKARAHF